MFSAWNAMKGRISAADSGELYLIPCFTESDLSKRLAIDLSAFVSVESS